MPDESDSQRHTVQSLSPTTITSSSLPPTQMQNAYPYSPQLSSGESFRHPAPIAAMHHASMNLPPLRMETQVQHQQLYAQLSSPHLPTYYAVTQPPMMGHPGAMMQPLTAGPGYISRYPIPVAVGRPNKKEIKRRTKTGCMTCRKRRIKCDEQHPVCRNCIKSKRECLGYDPIFKNQSNQSNNAPSQSSASPAASTCTSTTSPTTVSTTVATSSHNLVSTQATASPATLQSRNLPHTYGSPVHHNAVQPLPQTSSASHYTTRTTAATHYVSASPIHSMAPTHSYSPTVKLPAMTPYAQVGASSGVMRSVPIQMLFVENSQLPYDGSDIHEPLSQSTLYSINRHYSDHLAPALDSLLEVDWYSKHGLGVLLQDDQICRQLAALINCQSRVDYSQPSHTDLESRDRIRALESKVVWSAICLIRHMAAYKTSSSHFPDRDHHEALPRLQILEALLTNTVLESNPLHNFHYPTEMSSADDRNKIRFWYLLGQAVSQINESELWPILDTTIPTVLNGLENRDVLYSCFVCRYFADRIPNFISGFVGPPANQVDPVNRALVAKQFVMKQEDGQGTNIVIQRICHMASQSWNHR